MTITDLTRIRGLVVSTDTIRKTQAFLRKRGKDNIEAIVLWAGKPESSTTFRVTRPIFPVQHGTLISVEVDAEEIQRIDDECRARGEVLGAQLHTHPTTAFHSPTDDATPIVNKIGAYSLVIPDFAEASLTDLSRAVVVQVRADGWSNELDKKDRLHLIQVDR